MGEEQQILLLFLFIFLAALLTNRRRLQKGIEVDFRILPAFNKLRNVVPRAVESGKSVHLSLGLGGISTNATADSLAGLEVLEHVANQSAAYGVSPLVTVADPTLLPLAHDTLHRPPRLDRDHGMGLDTRLRWLAPESSAYAAGVMDILGTENVQSNVMVGAFGDEYLLMGEAARRHCACHIGAASDPNVLPFVYATADEMLVGEEMYAAGAYLSEKPWHISSLLAQDWMRWAIVLAIIGLVIAKTVL